MKKYKYYNRLIIDNDSVCLANSNEINEVVYNTGDYGTLYRFEDGAMVADNSETLYESDFENLYEEYTDYDEECGHEKIEIEDWSGDIIYYVKAEWGNYEHYLQLESEHGINTSYYDITDADVIEGKCFEADGCISQDYPKTECQCFYKFVSNDGKEYYIKRTLPFFSDECDDECELITKEEFEEYD